MKLVLFGTGPFAVPSFESLLNSDHRVVAMVTRPIADAGKRRKSAENPSRDLAERYGLVFGETLFDPDNANDPAFVATLKNLHADLFVVCDYGQILSRECLAAARRGGINLHGSLLPKYRGAAPVHWAIYNGELVTGVTIIHMTPRLDGGPGLAWASIPIGADETTGDLEPRLAQLGVEPVHLAIKQLESWDGVSPIGQLQDPALATKAPRLKKTDGEIVWSRTAAQIVNQIRAFQPWPGSYTFWCKDPNREPERLIIHRAQVMADADQPTLSPGQVFACDPKRLWVQTGDGILAVLEVQPAGKRGMVIEEFLRGQAIGVGDSFG